MTATVAELEKRVAALESELSYLRQMLGIWAPGETPAEAEQSQAEFEAIWARVKE